MTKVNLRKKPITGGRETLYLDFWPPIPTSTGKETRREFLGLYILSKPRTPLEKQTNKQTLEIAEHVKAQRQIDIQSGAYKIRRSGGGTRLVDYMETLASKKSESTEKVWKKVLPHIVKAELDKVTMPELELKHCTQFREYLEKMIQSKALNSTSASTYLSLFRQTLRQADNEGVLINSLAGRIQSIKKSEPKKSFLTIEELNTLASTPIDSEIIKTTALFSALTGLRLSDIRGLKWNNVLGEKDNATLDYTQVKTKKRHILPISSQARGLIGSKGEDEKDDGIIFKGIPTIATVCYILKAWTTRAGIKKHITFHCMRHSFATNQLGSGTSLKVVSTMLGHASIAMTETYAKVQEPDERKASARVILKT